MENDPLMLGWLLVAFVLVGLSVVSPKLLELTAQYTDLTLRRWYFMVRMWPRIQFDLLWFRFKIWWLRHNGTLTKKNKE